MIIINDGLTEEEKAKVSMPYAANCGAVGGYDMEAAGKAAAAFVERNQDTFKKVLGLLNDVQAAKRTQ